MSAAAPTLALNGIHVPPAPSWWPPAPGWWVVAALVLFGLAFVGWRVGRRQWRRRRWAAMFDAAIVGAQTPAAQVAAMSELLRRAARRVDAAAGTLEGDAWLRFLDRGTPRPAFDGRVGALLHDGGFRREVAVADVEALRTAARARFLDWMSAR